MVSTRFNSLFCLALFLALAVIACGNTPVNSGEEGESGIQYEVSDTAKETRQGISLTMNYNTGQERFVGTLTNTTTSAVGDVRVEIHLSNGTELGPTPRVEMSAGQIRDVSLDAKGQSFDRWSVHVEIGSGEGGGEHGSGGDSGGS